MNAPRQIHLWVPELLGVGGIQHYSRTLLRGLDELLPETKIRVLSKNDPPAELPSDGRISFRSTGAAPAPLRTARFCSLLMGQTALRRPDLAIMTHLHFAPVAHALKRLFGLRYWISAHGIEAWGPLSPLMRKALAGAERILPVSRHTEGRMENASHRSFILPNAVDENIFYPGPKPIHLLRRYGLDEKRKILFTLARLDSPERYKGYDRVLEALPRIREKIPGIHYLLAGRGPENERIRHRARQLGLERQVTLTGFLPDRDLREHYHLCDLFAMPSLGEGFGIVYLEALACGRPVLAGNQDGSREPLLDGELGTLVNPQDSTALADIISGLLLKPNPSHDPAWLRRRMLDRFGFEAFKERLRVLLKS